MKFKMNNVDWEIKEVDHNIILNTLDKICGCHNNGIYFGLTCPEENIIYINNNLPISRKKKTLLHELGHCYLIEFVQHAETNYDEEFVCDIISNSHNIIGDIINKYFESGKHNG